MEKLEDLTQKQINALARAELARHESPDGAPLVIAILQRGWVYVGRLEQDGEMCSLTSAGSIRRWGTTQGLGEIASGGPTDKTKIDDCPPVRFHVLTSVAIMDCEADKWPGR